MKKKFIGLLLCFIAAISFNVKGAYQEGVLYLNNGDSIACLIGVYKSDVFIYSKKIRCKIEGAKKRIKASQVQAIRFGDLLYEKFSVKHRKQVQRGPRKVWKDYFETFYACKIIDGEVKLYNRYSVQTTGSYGNGMYVMTSRYLATTKYVKTNENFVKIIKLGFKNDCINLFQPCNEAVEKIESKYFVYNTLKSLIVFINENCY